MSTYGQVKARIAREMHRNDLTSDIVTHLAAAIDHYASRRTWKNEGSKTITTTANTATKAAPDGLQKVDRVAIVVNGADYELVKIDATAMADLQGAPVTIAGQPGWYSWESGAFKFYPVPDAVYTVNVLGIYDDTALANDDDTSSWTTIAENLIVARTKKTLYRDVTANEGGEQRAARAEKEYRGELFAKAGEKTATNIIKSGW